ncbi:MAG TPA: SIMPL domain-containing protein [Armatimonadota bacterium]|jgi:uncharacterized protein YggE
MRKGAALVVLALAIVVTSAAWGAEAPAANVIHASGHAVVKVVADTARVECGVKTQGPTGIAVSREAEATMTKLRDAANLMNLPGMSVTDTGVVLTARQYRYPINMPAPPSMGGPRAPEGKVASNTDYTAVGGLIVTLHGDEATLHLNAARMVAALGAVSPNLVTARASFLKEDDSQEQQTAYEQAMHNAVANAQALARGLGVTISGYGTVSMIPPPAPPAAQNPWMDFMTMMMAQESGGDHGLWGDATAPDTKGVQVEVTVYLDAMYK